MPIPTYEDITRRTVIEPDGGRRPSVEQERQAFEGFRQMDMAEQTLYDHVREALRRSGVDVQRVSIEVEHDRVTLAGLVDDEHALVAIGAAIGAVEGVGSVDDRLSIAPVGAA